MRLGKSSLFAAVVTLFGACAVYYASIQSAEATELLGPEEGALPFGMGRAYTAVADDWLALHYNPAGLALMEGVDLTLADTSIAANKEIYSKYDEFKDLNDAGSDAEKLNTLLGSQVWGRLGHITQLTLPNFAAAIKWNRTISFDNQNAVYPTVRIRDTQDLTFMAGIGVGIGRANNRTKALRLGAHFRLQRRTGGIKEIPVAEIGANQTAFLERFDDSGYGYAGTLGMQYTLPIKGRIEYTLGFAWHDIGKTSFGKSDSSDRPTRVEDNMVAGLMVRLPIGGAANRRVARRWGHPRSSSHLTFAFDYSHLNIGSDDEQVAKHIHAGLNLDLPIISVQAGVNQSSFTAGAHVNLPGIRIGAVTWGEELGSYADQRRDRRYMLSIATGLGFSDL